MHPDGTTVVRDTTQQPWQLQPMAEFHIESEMD